MKQYIKEITSDSTLKNFQMEGDYLCITVRLYSEEEIHVELEEVQAFTSPLWSPVEDIEGVLMNDESNFLKETKEHIKIDALDANIQFYSFQFLNSPGDNLFEIVAKRLKINDKVYE